jgi:hypothetical protein
MKFACHYSIARFLPYAETGEFVNIGVALLCPRAGYFHFRLARRWRRVTDFFQELDGAVYKSALRFFEQDLLFFGDSLGTSRGPQMPFPVSETAVNGLFRQLTRPRESLFRFGEIRTALVDDPEAKLRQLFDYYVDRQFARDKEYQETLMANNLRTTFVREELARYYRAESLGDENYEVPVPFAYRQGEHVVKAIKPLDLDKSTSTKIFEHGDQWINRVKRLREKTQFPDQMLFAVRQPNEGTKRRAAGLEIAKELKALDTIVVPFANQEAVIQFARVA